MATLITEQIVLKFIDFFVDSANCMIYKIDGNEEIESDIISLKKEIDNFIAKIHSDSALDNELTSFIISQLNYTKSIQIKEYQEETKFQIFINILKFIGIFIPQIRNALDHITEAKEKRKSELKDYLMEIKISLRKISSKINKEDV